jgi:hypothetical protein
MNKFYNFSIRAVMSRSVSLTPHLPLSAGRATGMPRKAPFFRGNPGLPKHSLSPAKQSPDAWF